MIDVTGERGPASEAVAAFKQMLTTVMSTPAPLTLAVGETTTVPDPLKAPLSAAAVPGAIGEFAITGETRYTLTSITFDGADRIAHLTTTRSVTFSRGSSAGPGSDVTFEERISGDGTLDVNIDRGIVLHSGQHLIIDGTTHMAARNGGAAHVHANARHHDDQLGRYEVARTRGRRSLLEKCGAGGLLSPPGVEVGHFSSRRTRNEEVSHPFSKCDASQPLWHRSCIVQ